ncbi:MAG: M28 family peptidase [Candidatus Cyclobacteriaceae bacterium M2_1C_046]
MKKITIFLIVFFPFVSYGQLEKAKPYAETITEEDLRDYITILASDALEGRKTGERGQRMAAAFIKSHFMDWGLEGPVKESSDAYYQQVPLYTVSLKNAYIKTGDKTFDNYGDIMYYGQYDTNGDQSIELIYGGPGSEEVFSEINPENKGVVVFSKDRNWRKPAKNATDAGAEIVFVVMGETAEDFDKMVNQYRPHIEEGRMSLKKPEGNSDNKGVFFISPDFAASVFGQSVDKLKEINQKAEEGELKKLKKIKPVKASYMVDTGINEIKSENVLAYLPGTDLKDELIVLTAHYDHVGKKGEEIYNGADDDASGTASVMEIAEAFVKAAENGDRPRRSLLFMLVTGEEEGLLGSAYYAENPIYPLANTIVNLNIDMVGRVDPKHIDNPNYVYLVGADRLSTELHEISEATNKATTNYELDYTYNDENHPDRIYYRSDHWNFAKNNVPIIFYFNGVHEDYHKPTDTVDKINFDVLQDRAELVFYTTWALANRDTRPMVDKGKTEGSK